ncbi:MAG: polynucleotide adenylyltransferase [Clostridia bacterium]|nr:polynucleotide adenylyltransferase [Clostridia bacterium]
MHQFNMIIPASVNFALSKLETFGYEAYVVGGAVRDAMLGRALHDYDITTSASPEEIKTVFADFHTILTGEKHGTVTVVIEGEPLEITTYRIDGDYTDGRRPDSVEFTKNITEDLARRDFTVNAMAYSLTRGLCDPFGGAEDLKIGVIRAVGDPIRRFTEDSLRILRGFRFAARLGFEIEEKTLSAAKSERKRLSAVSAERIGSEVLGLLSAEKPSHSLCLMHSVHVLGEIMPSVYFETLAQNNFKAIDFIPDNFPEGLYLKKEREEASVLGFLSARAHLAAIRLGMLLRDSDKSLSTEIPKKLKMSTELSAITSACASGILPKRGDLATVRTYASGLTGKITPKFAYFILLAAGARGERLLSGDSAMLAAQNLFECAERGEPMSISELAVSGRDLLDSGVAPGARVGEVLSELLASVLANPDFNTRENLLSLVRDMVR